MDNSSTGLGYCFWLPVSAGDTPLGVKHIFISKSWVVEQVLCVETVLETCGFCLKAKNGQNYLICHMKAFHESFKSLKKWNEKSFETIYKNVKNCIFIQTFRLYLVLFNEY